MRCVTVQCILHPMFETRLVIESHVFHATDSGFVIIQPRFSVVVTRSFQKCSQPTISVLSAHVAAILGAFVS